MNKDLLDSQVLTLIDRMLSSETRSYYDIHHHYPIGRQCEDVVDNVYPRLQSEGIFLSYGELYDHYLAVKDDIIRNL